MAGGLVGAVAAWAMMASNVTDAILAQAGPSATLLPFFSHPALARFPPCWPEAGRQG